MPLAEPPWRKPARQPLSREKVVDTALAIVDAEGMDALSMRRIAQVLETGPASLYAHVANKEELQELLLERVLSEVEHEVPDPARWQAQLRSLCQRTLAALTAHRGVAKVALATIVPSGEHSLLQAEAILGLLRAGGIPDQVAAVAFDVLSSYCTAFAVEVDAMRSGEFDTGQRVEQLGQYMASLPPDRFPALLALGPMLGGGDGDERFAAAIDLIISGLATRR